MNGVINEYATPIRLYDFEMVCGAAEDNQYPDEYEIPRENTGTLKSQGTVSACVACVISQIAEVLHKVDFGETEEMSEGYAYGALRNPDSKSEGMLVTTALNYWHKLGIVPKKYLDILTEMPEMKKVVEKFPELAEIAAQHKIGGYSVINYADKNKKDLAIKKALTENERPLLAVSNDYFRESHCIELVGWNDKNNKYKIKNSWGTTYGDKGFGEIPKDEINQVYVILPQELELPFTDVDKNAWYYKYIKQVYFNGLMKGTSETTFEPERFMTRAEVATLVANILEMVDDRFDNFNKVLNEKLD